MPIVLKGSWGMGLPAMFLETQICDICPQTSGLFRCIFTYSRAGRAEHRARVAMVAAGQGSPGAGVTWQAPACRSGSSSR